jgi:methionyl aminopeptidase
VKCETEIAKIRIACRVAAQALQLAEEASFPGITTAEVDSLVHRFIVSQGGYPVGINFHGFPRAMCSSVNNVVVHGIPDERPLEEGDIVNYDVAAFVDGAFGDNSRMVQIGNVDPDGQRLCDVTRRAVEAAIAAVGPGKRLSLVGETIDKIARDAGYTIVREFVGHFVGRELHMLPNVVHTRNSEPLILRPGMVFTIEPILCEGRGEITSWEDGWTYVTKDDGRAAQWEHTIAITETGVEVLTQAPDVGLR